MYIVLYIAASIPPTPEIYRIYFQGVRPTNVDNEDQQQNSFVSFFRWLLGSRLDAGRADEAVRRATPAETRQ